MKRTLLTLILVGLAAVCWTPRAGAQEPDEILTRTSKGKPAYKGVIAAESPRGLTVKGVADVVAAEEIEDISFDKTLKPLAARFAYRIAEEALKKALTSTKETDRTKALAEALGKYQEALAKYEEGVARKDAGPALAKGALDYKIAFLTYLQARDSGKEPALQAAVKQLRAFRTAHPKAWQTSRALRMLAQLHMDLRQFGEAEKVYRELAAAGVANEVAQDAEVQARLVTLEAGKQARAEAKQLETAGKGEEAKQKAGEAAAKLKEAAASFEKLAGTLPKESPQQLRARVALAECVGTSGDLAKASDALKKVLAETKDKGVRTQAHNTLGYCYWLHSKWQDARWEFLWVDVVYNQDKAEHAKALYYLADIFARLGEGERARECRETLLTERQFAGSEYQRLALRERKTE